MAGETKGAGEPMNQKFYTLEESLLEKSADSPKPKKKRLARASPQMPAPVSSGRQDDSVSQPLSQRFYSDTSVDHPKYGERNVTEYNPTTQHNPEPSSFIDASCSAGSSLPNAAAKRANRWVYSANVQRKGDETFRAGPADETFAVGEMEHSLLTEKIPGMESGGLNANDPPGRLYNRKKQIGKGV